MQSTSENSAGAQPSFCIIIPSYNNGATLKKVIEEVIEINASLIVINDGSSDDTEQILLGFPETTVIHFKSNKGKGAALRAGFKKAFEMGFDYGVTIDSDGQHLPSDIPALEIKAKENNGALIMGSRNMDQESVPKKSSFGNAFSNFWYWAETLNRLSDTQTGFRAYPLSQMHKKRWYTRGFEFEIEAIVRLAWSNVPVFEVPVNVLYRPDRVSHFRPFTDFARISVLNTVLFTLALIYFIPRKLVRTFSPRKIANALNKELKRNRDEPLKMAASIGAGLFFGIFPIWGFQMLTAFAFASFFKLNRVIVILFANISIPPVIPIIILLSYQFGALFVSDPIKLLSLDKIDRETIYLQIEQYLIGAALLSVLSGILGFIVAYALIKLRSSSWIKR